MHHSKTYIITTFHGTQIEVSEQTKNEILESIRIGNKMFMIGSTGEGIPLSPVPEIMLSTRKRAADRDKLAKTRQWRCKHGRTHSFTTGNCTRGAWSGCGCDVNGVSAEYAPLAIEPTKRDKQNSEYMKSIKSLSAKIGSFPKLSYQEKLKARADGGEPRANSIINQQKNA